MLLCGEISKAKPSQEIWMVVLSIDKFKDGPVDRAEGGKVAGPVPVCGRQIAGTGTFSGDGKRSRIPEVDKQTMEEGWEERTPYIIVAIIAEYSKGRRRDGDWSATGPRFQDFIEGRLSLRDHVADLRNGGSGDWLEEGYSLRVRR